MFGSYPVRSPVGTPAIFAETFPAISWSIPANNGTDLYFGPSHFLPHVFTVSVIILPIV